MSLSGKVAVVTGASRGIGRGIAVRLARDGADVVVNATSEAGLRPVVAEVAALGRRCVPVAGDVSRRDDCYRLVQQAVEHCGRLDIMVNNAGVTHICSISETREEDWDRVMAINAKGVFLCCQAAAQHMIAQGAGKIINLGSSASLEGFKYIGAYSASKFAVVALTQTLAKELGEHGITVNCVCPGIVDTDMWQVTDEGLARYLHTERGGAFRQYCAGILLKQRPGTPEDIAGTVAFLASPDGDYLTGCTISVSGGLTLH